MGWKVTEIQPTPNPNAMKFVLDGDVFDVPRSFFSVEAARGNKLAEALFGVTGVSSLLFLGDFITVNKCASVRWTDINQKVKKVLAEA